MVIGIIINTIFTSAKKVYYIYIYRYICIYIYNITKWNALQSNPLSSSAQCQMHVASKRYMQLTYVHEQKRSSTHRTVHIPFDLLVFPPRLYPRRSPPGACACARCSRTYSWAWQGDPSLCCRGKMMRQKRTRDKQSDTSKQDKRTVAWQHCGVKTHLKNECAI